MNSRTRKCCSLAIAVLAVATASAAQASADAGKCSYVAVDIGEVPKGQSEIVSGPALAKALAENPGCEVVAINLICRPTDMVKDNHRFFYDKKQCLLVYMLRSAMIVGEDTYMWRIWYDVGPADFAKRLPYGREDVVTKGSWGRDPKTQLLLEYKGPKEATEWP